MIILNPRYKTGNFPCRRVSGVISYMMPSPKIRPKLMRKIRHTWTSTRREDWTHETVEIFRWTNCRSPSSGHLDGLTLEFLRKSSPYLHTHLLAHHEPFRMCSQNQGKTRAIKRNCRVAFRSRIHKLILFTHFVLI